MFTWAAELVDPQTLPNGASADFDQATGVVTVDGLRPGQTATVRGHRHQPPTTSPQAAPPKRPPRKPGRRGRVDFVEVTRGPDAGVVTAKIKDYDQAVTDGFAFAVVPGWSPNTATASLTGDTLTVTGLADGQEASVTVEATQTASSDTAVMTANALGNRSRPDLRRHSRHRRGHPRPRTGSPSRSTTGPTPTCSPGPRNWSTPRPCPTGHQLTSTRPPVWSPRGRVATPAQTATVRVTATNPDYLPGSATQEAAAQTRGRGRWTSWR